MFHDYMKVVSKLAAAYAEYKEMSKKIVSEMPDHEKLNEIVAKTRKAFNMEHMNVNEEENNKTKAANGKESSQTESGIIQLNPALKRRMVKRNNLVPLRSEAKVRNMIHFGTTLITLSH